MVKPPTTRSKSSLTFMDAALMPWALISEVYWMSWKLLERRFYHLGITASQARVLSVLYYSDAPVRPSVVATVLFQETQSITGMLHRLEERGWVQRQPDPEDKRAVGLRLSSSGRKLAAEIVDISKQFYADFFGAALTAPEVRSMAAPLKKVRALGFNLPETDFKLRHARDHAIWRD